MNLDDVKRRQMNPNLGGNQLIRDRDWAVEQLEEARAQIEAYRRFLGDLVTTLDDSIRLLYSGREVAEGMRTGQLLTRTSA